MLLMLNCGCISFWRLGADEERNRDYLAGRIINDSELKDYLAFSFLPEQNFSLFKAAKSVKKKKELLVKVFFGQIEFIKLEFDSYDWKK